MKDTTATMYMLYTCHVQTHRGARVYITDRMCHQKLYITKITQELYVHMFTCTGYIHVHVCMIMLTRLDQTIMEHGMIHVNLYHQAVLC